MKVQLAAVRIDSERFDLQRNQALFTPQRIEQLARRPIRDQRRSVAGQWLLNQLLAEYVPGLPLPPRLIYGEQDKPTLADAPLHFNLSHSGGWAVCALAEMPVGVDIQEARLVRCSVARRFAPSEQKLLNGLTGDQRQNALLDLWCLKEAYCKCTGKGLLTPLDEAAFTLKPVRIDRDGYTASLIDFEEGYHLAVCLQWAGGEETAIDSLEPRRF